ncbi:MAG TPA: hypothetical protein VFQ45_16700 [Longimicrobium sp.]|nr:hypothetical protein [Longimicrobium sp.]
MRRLAPAVVLGVMGCAGGDAAPGGPARVVATDSAWAVSWNPVEDRARVYTVELRARGRVREVTGVVEPLPVLVGDSAMAGVLVRGREAQRHLFRMHARRGLRTWPVPGDAWPLFRDVAISPGGRQVAYVGGDTHFAAIVRDVESGRLVVRGPPMQPCECDVDRNHARWVDADSFEIAADGLGGGRWLLVAGRASARRFRLDTLAAEPGWH